MTREKLIEDAREFWLAGRYNTDHQTPQLMADFALQHLSRTGWTAIKDENDLPYGTGEYLVTMHTPSTDQHVTTLRFYAHWRGDFTDDRVLIRLRRENWLPYKDGQWAIAWQKLPQPFTPEERQDAK